MGINLSKGGSINLTKSSSQGLKNLCFGVNWGMITTTQKGLFGSKQVQEAVDLDASLILYNSNKEPVELIYFGNKTSRDGAIKHSGDDLTGDSSADDSDNETIVADLEKLDNSIKYIAVVLHSFRGQTFDKLPYANLRVYTGKPNNPSEVLATFKVNNEPAFAGKVGMILGVATKSVGGWDFRVHGEALNDRRLEETRNTAISYLQ